MVVLRELGEELLVVSELEECSELDEVIAEESVELGELNTKDVSNVVLEGISEFEMLVESSMELAEVDEETVEIKVVGVVTTVELVSWDIMVSEEDAKITEGELVSLEEGEIFEVVIDDLEVAIEDITEGELVSLEEGEIFEVVIDDLEVAIEDITEGELVSLEEGEIIDVVMDGAVDVDCVGTMDVRVLRKVEEIVVDKN